MRAVRFDAELERAVEWAAQKCGVTVSEFIRRAVRRECEAVRQVPEAPQGWKDVLHGPHAEEWAPVLEEILGGGIDGETGEQMTQEEAMKDWARVIHERNWRQ
jgi:hypothetical protein